MDPHPPPQPRSLGVVLLWAARVVWLLQPLGINAYGDALDGRSGAVQAAAAIGLWAGWGVALIALLVPAVSTLTIVRQLVPAAVVAAVWATLAGAGGATAAVAITLAALATLLVFSGDVGQIFVQASAYGAEQRMLLRPPPAWVVIVVITWALTVAGVFAGWLLTASGTWLIGVPVLVIGAALAWQGGVRTHRLSRRWIVFVPAGVVIHDHVVLADAHLFRIIDIATVGVAFEDSGALDVTGGALGPALEIQLRELRDVLLAATPSTPRGTMLHVRALLVSPTRPGRALVRAGEIGLPRP